MAAERFAILGTLNASSQAAIGALTVTLLADFGLGAYSLLDYLLTPANLDTKVDDVHAISPSGKSYGELRELGGTLRH